MATKKASKPTPNWSEVIDFKRAGLLRLLQDLYATSEGNKDFLHTHLELGESQATSEANHRHEAAPPVFAMVATSAAISATI